MTEHQQTAIFGAMENPDFYPHAASTIEQRDTHISKVFLTGNYAYKIKEPVNLEFLDFTTLEKRRHFCWQEINLNRRLAPDVYLDVVPITLQDGRYHMARDMDANITFIECAASYEMLKKRLADREKTVCISDARLRHLKQHKAHFESSDDLQNDMHLKINTEESIDACMRQILSHDYIFLNQQTARAMENLSS